MKNYQKTISCHVTAEQAYRAITEQMSQWWTPMSAQFLTIGDTAKTDFGGNSYWVFEVVRLEEYKNIELVCCEANHVHEGLSSDIREEWLDTKLKFEIDEQSDMTNITLTHIGLTPDLLCFDICDAGWNHYFSESLKDFLNMSQAEI